MSDTPSAGRLATIETLYRLARDRRDRADIAVARGDLDAVDTSERAAVAALAAVREALTEVPARHGDAGGTARAHTDAAPEDATPEAPSRHDAGTDAASHDGVRTDATALHIIRTWAAEPTAATTTDTGTIADTNTGAHTGTIADTGIDTGTTDIGTTASAAPDIDRRFAAAAEPIEAAYAAAQGAVDIGDATVTRLAVLERLATEPDPNRRRALFLSLRPVWRAIDGDGNLSGSPYQQRLLPLSRRRWAAGASPVDANARALGLKSSTVEAGLLAILETWRAAFATGAPIEPWDWWYAAGAASRELNETIPLERIRAVSDAYHAALGADPVALGVCFDVFPRPGRPPVPVAYTDFGGRPERHSDGTRIRATPWVMGTYTAGGLGELTELVHETGHAIHVAAIDTRPAFADWPDSDAFTEAIAELTALDTAEPAWQRRWLGLSVPAGVSLRGRYADVMLDICWAVLEMRLHRLPDARPNTVWADLTSRYLGITRHPELSWWAMRGQLVQEPGYMVNYALGPILAADMRAAIRQARGDWTGGDPGWFEWVSDHIYRWGLERSSGDVLALLLGRAPTPDALVQEIRRGAPD